jgi:hypothetical protein
MPTAQQWSKAFAAQARVDWQTWNLLRNNPDFSVPVCHRLHFLQMACEKVCKAHLCLQGINPSLVQSSHAYVAKTLPIICREQLRRRKLRAGRLDAVVHFAKRLAREIELLAPSVDDGGRRPDNCEYPWVDGLDCIHLPAEWQFDVTTLLKKPLCSSIFKVIADALDRLV